MKSLILCTTASDSICKLALDSLEMKKIRFKHCDKPVGPHGIRVYSDTVITANSYNDSVSFFYGGCYDSGTLHHRADFQYCQLNRSQEQLLVSGPRVYSL